MARSRPSAAPSAIIAAAPSSSSSAGWNTSATRPARNGASSWRTAAAPSRVAVWMSCPQACILPGTVEAKGRPVSSPIGSASMSARMASVGPGRPPSMVPTIPVRPRPVRCGMPRRAQLGRDDPRGARFLEAELRVRVHVATQRNQSRLQRCRRVPDALGRIVRQEVAGPCRHLRPRARRRPRITATHETGKRPRLARPGFPVPYAPRPEKRGGRCPGACRAAPPCWRPWRSPFQRRLPRGGGRRRGSPPRAPFQARAECLWPRPPP